MLKELRDFLLRGNVLDLAVAVVLGAAFNAIVQAFANDVLLGLVGAVFGSVGPAEEAAVVVNGAPVVYGALVGAIVNFVIVGTAVFFIVRGAARFQRRPETAETEATPVPTDEVQLLTEIRDQLRARPAAE